jgi:hypothetical protein
LVVCKKKERNLKAGDPPGWGERWGLVIQDRRSRFVVAHASGRREEALAAEAIQKAHARSQGRPVGWCSDGWRAYPKAITRAYREPVRTGVGAGDRPWSYQMGSL